MILPAASSNSYIPTARTSHCGVTSFHNGGEEVTSYLMSGNRSHYRPGVITPSERSPSSLMIRSSAYKRLAPADSLPPLRSTASQLLQTNRRVLLVPLAGGVAQTPASSAPPSPSSVTKYSHFENASVFLALAKLLLDANGTVSPLRPYCNFLDCPEDPPVEIEEGGVGKSLVLRLTETVRCKYPCYVLALLYLRRIKSTRRGFIDITPRTFQRLCLTAVIVGTKFYDDIYYSNEHYAQGLEVPLAELNSLELGFLVLVKFRLKVSTINFDMALSCFDQSRIKYCHGLPMSGLSTSTVPLPPPSLLLAAHSGLLESNEEECYYRAEAKLRSGISSCFPSLQPDGEGDSDTASTDGGLAGPKQLDSYDEVFLPCIDDSKRDGADDDVSALCYTSMAAKELAKCQLFGCERERGMTRYETEEEHLLRNEIYAHARYLHKLVLQSQVQPNGSKAS